MLESGGQMMQIRGAYDTNKWFSV